MTQIVTWNKHIKAFVEDKYIFGLGTHNISTMHALLVKLNINKLTYPSTNYLINRLLTLNVLSLHT